MPPDSVPSTERHSPPGSAATVPVTVFLNECPNHRFDTYIPDHCAPHLHPAVAYEVRQGLKNVDVLEDAFVQFNVGTNHDPVVARYRGAGNRSLSVSDVVQIADTRFVCERAGWREVTV